METAGEDPTVVSEFGKAFVEGIAGNSSTLIAAAAPKQCAERNLANYLHWSEYCVAVGCQLFVLLWAGELGRHLSLDF